MSAAFVLIRAVEANGGYIRVDGEYLVIAPGDAAEPVIEELRQHKAEIIGLLQIVSFASGRHTDVGSAFGFWSGVSTVTAGGAERVRCTLTLFAGELTTGGPCQHHGRPL